ncbi:MAG: lamin tail domain-containing protein [Vicinamibacterales bacterium]
MRLQTLSISAATVALILAGCGGHSSSNKNKTIAPVTTAPVNTNNPPPPPPPTTTLTVSAPVGSLAAARIGPDAVAMALEVAVTGGGSARLTGMTLTAAGTIDESTGLGALKIVGDDNRNGLVDAGERVMANVAAPAFATDNGTVAVTFTQSITIASGASIRVIVAVDASATGATAVAKIGKTVELQIAAAGDVTATAASQPITPAGSFPVSGGITTLFLHDHLLITEVAPRPTFPTCGEFVEIFNPTGQTVDLSNYYLTDATNNTNPVTNYQNVATGAGFAVPLTSDWLVRFPAGATIAPGQVVVVAIDAVQFSTAYPGKTANYAIRTAGPQTPFMRIFTAGAWTQATAGTGVGLTDAGEPVILFTWDGQSDLVKDVDYMFYGTPSATNANVEKTGISVDGPDAGTNPSTFLVETPAFQQSTRSAPPAASDTVNALQRIDFVEGSEAKTGGNGITGNDETSEVWNTTFINGAATPGVP